MIQNWDVFKHPMGNSMNQTWDDFNMIFTTIFWVTLVVLEKSTITWVFPGK